MYVVSSGNAFDGISLQGPFVLRDKALAFAENGRNGCDAWNIVEVDQPVGHELRVEEDGTISNGQ